MKKVSLEETTLIKNSDTSTLTEYSIFLNDKNVYVTAPVNIGDLVKINLEFEEESENIISIKMNLKIHSINI